MLHDIGHQDGVDFLVTELVEGETLERRLTKRSLPPGADNPLCRANSNVRSKWVRLTTSRNQIELDDRR